MNFTRLLPLCLSVSSLLVALTGCGSHVISGGSSNGPGTETDPSIPQPVDDCGGPTDPNAPQTAILYVKDAGSYYGTSGQTGGSGETTVASSSTSPGAPSSAGYTLVVSSGAVACTDPTAVPSICSGDWAIYIDLAPEQLVIGQVQLDLHNASYFESENGGEGNCGGGGGSVESGLLTITNVDGAMVHGFVSGISGALPAILNGEQTFDAARCDAQ